MIIINSDDLTQLEKYYDSDPTEELVSNLVDDLAQIIGKASNQDIDIIQDVDVPTYYRLYAGNSATDVYVVNGVIQIDFDLSFKIINPQDDCIKSVNVPECENI